MRWLLLILLFFVGVGGCNFMFDELFNDGYWRKRRQEDRALRALTEEDEEK